MIEFSFCFFIFNIIVIYTIDRLTTKRVWHDPLYIFLFFMILYVSPLSLRYIYNMPAEGNVTHYFDDLRHIYPFALFFTTISVVLFYISYRTSPIIKITKKIDDFANRIEKRKLNFKLSAYFLLFFGIILFGILTKTYGGVVEVILRGYAVTEIFTKNPLISISISIISTSSILLLCEYAQSRQKKHLLFSLVIITSIIILQIILARRAAIAIWVLTYLISFSYLIKRQKFIKILPLVLIGFVFLNILGYARGANYESISSFKESLSNQFERLENDKSGMFYTLVTGQFVIPFETVPMLMEKLSPSEMRYGTTLLDIITQWIPRSIWPEKNYGNTEWYYKKYYDNQASSNEGRAFFFLAEGYLNFGIFGMLIWAILWGWIWRNIAFLANDKRSQTILGGVIVASYTGSMIVLLPGDFIGLFVGFIKSFLLWLIVAYIIAIIFSKNRKI